MDTISPTPRNMIGPIADALRTGRDWLNKPGKIAGIGLGDLLAGQAPEMLDNASYGQSPFSHGAGMTTRMDPGLVDAAMLPGVASLPALLRRGATVAVETAPKAVDMGRRAALETMGKGAVAAGMTASSVPHVLSALKAAPAKAIAAEAVPLAVKAEAGLSAKALAALGKTFQNVHAEQIGEGVPHAVEEMIANAKRVSGVTSDAAAARGLDNLAGIYGHGESYIPNPNGTFGHITLEDLEKMGIGSSPDDVIRAVFHGKVKAHDLDEAAIIQTGMARRPSDWNNLLDDFVRQDFESGPLASTPVQRN